MTPKHLALLLLVGCNISESPGTHYFISDEEFKNRPCVIVFAEKDSFAVGCGFDSTIPANTLDSLRESNRKMKGWKE